MKALVTGGGGFLGGAIVRLLKQRGHEALSFTRTAYPWLDELGIQQIFGDIADPAALEKALAGSDVVFHVAAKAGVWGRRDDFLTANVTGTQNVIAACKKLGVRKLVHTSTPSVVHGGRDLEGADESVPYPKQFEAEYPESKALAEKAVLAANGSELATVALRPHLIWGPGDPHLIPRILARAREGRLRRLGHRPVRIDATFIDNAAEAHLLAAEKLDIGSPIAGKVYFITNGEPVELWEFLNRILAEAGLPPVTKTVSIWKARLAGRILEWVYRVLRLPGEPSMTRYVASQLATSHWYNIAAARRDLGYEPHVSMEEGLKRLGEKFRGA
jgi:nucleoside-diphosphate-sugar epimerase